MKIRQSKTSNIMLEVAAYITLVSVALGTTLPMRGDPRLWSVMMLYVAVGVVMAFQEWANKRGYSWVYLLVVTALVSGFYFLGVPPGLYLVIFFIISAQAMMTLPAPWDIAWVVLLALISSLSFVAAEGIKGGLIIMLVYGGGYLFFGIFGKALMQATEERAKSEALYAELQAAHAQLQEYVYRVEELAATKERNRLAREMHDSLGHRLTVAAVQLEGAQRLIPQNPEKAAEMVGTVREQVRQALSELRQTVAALREPIEADLSIEQMLERLVKSFEAGTGLEVNLHVGELPLIQDSARLVLFRTIQEALTNVQRHAGADQVWLHLTHQGGWLSLLVSDNGKGYPSGADKNGFGLRGIRERVAQVGGESFFENRPGGGAQISVKLPVEMPDAGEQADE